MNKSAKGGWTIIIILIILIVVFGFGFYGGQEAKKIEATCDIGIGGSFCWMWHKTIMGQFQEEFTDTGNIIKDFSEDLE